MIHKIKQWREDPVLFVRDNFGVEPDEWQKDVLMLTGGTDFKPRRRVAMRACTGPGKSAALAWIGWHRLACYAELGEHPKGAALSGEGRDNLRDNLWAELAKWQKRSEFLMYAFEWNKEQIYAKDHPETWFLSARSYPKEADEDAIGRSLSGLHSRFPFLLLDESGDMPIKVGQKAEQIFTGGQKDALICTAGNPTSTGGLLYSVCTAGKEQWQSIRITADPDDPKRTPRVDIEHAREMIARYGKDDPWVQATILGEFPEAGINQLLSLEQVEQATRRRLFEENYYLIQKRLGVDVARNGMDSTIIFPRQGPQAFKYVEMRNAKSHEIAARVMLAKTRWGSEAEFIDGTGGFGGGVVDSLTVAGQTPFEVHFSSKADDPRYYNKRAEIWFRMAEWVKKGASIPNDSRLIKELVAPQYSFKNGKFILEDKDQIKKRLGFSPDVADALALTFTMVDVPTAAGPYGIFTGAHRPGKAKTEQDDERIN